MLRTLSLLWTPNLPYRIPAAVLQILLLVANLWGCRWDKFVLFIFFIFVCCLRYLFCLSAYAYVFKFIEYCFEINVQGMLGVDSASARPCFDGTTRGLLESNFWVVTACGRSYCALVCVGYSLLTAEIWPYNTSIERSTLAASWVQNKLQDLVAGLQGSTWHGSTLLVNTTVALQTWEVSTIWG